jgi:hypothetical protein
MGLVSELVKLVRLAEIVLNIVLVTASSLNVIGTQVFVSTAATMGFMVCIVNRFALKIVLLIHVIGHLARVPRVARMGFMGEPVMLPVPLIVIWACVGEAREGVSQAVTTICMVISVHCTALTHVRVDVINRQEYVVCVRKVCVGKSVKSLVLRIVWMDVIKSHSIVQSAKPASLVISVSITVLLHAIQVNVIGLPDIARSVSLVFMG